MTTDTTAFIGDYPFRHVPATTVGDLLGAMDRVGIREAWVTHLPSLFWRDPHSGAAALYKSVMHSGRLLPIPVIHPGLPDWHAVLLEAVQHHAPTVRCDPGYLGLPPTGPEMTQLIRACAELDLPLQMAVRLEDQRQRHPGDGAGELAPWAVRMLIRGHPRARILVTHADRGFVEEVHFGSTPEEARRIWWDISWIWGPPEDHLASLLGTIGPERFVFGTGQPLRLPESSVAKLDLLDLPPETREAIESGNARALFARRSMVAR
jgi:predicted TIM-barrel fold metal-dependent hydrolase